ncbi:Triose-phosphate Transporter [Mortierella alpina]|uniref:Triose-phosphate Transporter n=1 Tax=Mortierella alpina TaxID=64518 RepID=A0A9P6J230_MORAP|nr:Triose-phosphate Transporter [Mortierella alpina]
MPDSSHGLIPEPDGGGGTHPAPLDPFDPTDPYDQRNHTLGDEHESFIDATADSYHAPQNPFADTRAEGVDSIRGRDGALWAKTSADYDSFDEDDKDVKDTSCSNSCDSATDSDFDSDYSSGEDADEDDGKGGYHDPADGEDELEDTQRLLVSSSNTRMGGMGMGMRVGETGTGTMIGLDLEPHENHRNKGRLTGQHDDDIYDTLPLSTLDIRKPAHQLGDEAEQEKRKRSSKASRQKSRRQRRKRRQEQPAEGPVLGLGAIRKEQVAMLAKKQLRVQMLWNVFYVFAWYSCSTALSFNFQFPLFTTSLHMVAQFGLSSLTLAALPALRPKATPTAKDFGTKIVPCAVASGLDIGLSNSSLKTITLAFYTMCKSSSLAFVLVFAFAFKLERPTWTLAGVIGVISMGLFMMVMSEVDFVLIGFIQVMMASVLGGLRWSLTQLLLERTDTKTGSLANPISTIFFLSPIMGICLCVVAGVFEGYGTIFRSEFFASGSAALGTLGLLFLGGLFAFAMVLAEFNLIARTSVVTLSVLGIIKEVVTIVVSSLVFHDHLSLVNILGLFVTLTGIGFYHFMKLREMKAKARRASKDLADMELAKATRRRQARALAKQQRLQERQPPSPPGLEEARNHSLHAKGHDDDNDDADDGDLADQTGMQDSSFQDTFILDEDEEEGFLVDKTKTQR